MNHKVVYMKSLDTTSGKHGKKTEWLFTSRSVCVLNVRIQAYV